MNEIRSVQVVDLKLQVFESLESIEVLLDGLEVFFVRRVGKKLTKIF